MKIAVSKFVTLAWRGQRLALKTPKGLSYKHLRSVKLVKRPKDKITVPLKEMMPIKLRVV
jgi:hypothetical protein